MRYLIAETSWALVALAQDLSDRGILLTRTDRPEDVAHFLQVTGADLLIADARHDGAGARALRRLRDAHPDLAIALVADRPDEALATASLAAGADTVIDARAPADEIAARLMAVARRAHGFASQELRYGPLVLDLATRRAMLDDAPLPLTPKVYEMLEYLALRPGRLVTREALLSHVYGLDGEPDSRVFDVYLCTLRGHLRGAGDAIRIETARGAGLRFRCAEPAAA